MQEPVRLPCLLGCTDAKDSLQHYLSCPRIFSIAKFIIPETSELPLVRCGLCMPNKVSLLICATTFTAYHAVKAEIRGFLNVHSSEELDFAYNWHVFAQLFSAVAVEHGLTATLFSADSFNNFLASTRAATSENSTASAVASSAGVPGDDLT